MRIRPRKWIVDPLMTHWTRHAPAIYRQRLNQQMHEKNLFCGEEWRFHLPVLQAYIPDLTKLHLLDFGCGPHGGLAKHLGPQNTPYDPYVSQYANWPWKDTIDIVFSTDVLEHLTQQEIDDFLLQTLQSQCDWIYLNISTRKATLRLPNGANTHLTVRPANWWAKTLKFFLATTYNVVHQSTDPYKKEVAFCLNKKS